MLKFPKDLAIAATFAAAAILGQPIGQAVAADPEAGAKVYNKCKACHAVGEGAKNRVGPHLNGVFGRTAGSLEDYKYSKAMREAGEEGLVWDDATLGEYLAGPRAIIKGTKMAFAGLKKEEDVANLLAWLRRESGGADAAADEEPQAEEAEPAAAPEQPDAKPQAEDSQAASEAYTPPADAAPHGTYNLGRRATEEEVAAWNIDIRPDGKGLPPGRGTVSAGETIYTEQCASCHGVFGEGAGRWPVLAGGFGTLDDQRPVKTVGSYWPYLSTVYDYVRRAMPFGDARSLSDDDVYAVTAFLLYLNDVVTDEDFELSHENFTQYRLPNEPNFKADDRASEAHYADRSEPCMTECKPGPVTVEMRAAVLDVTPDAENGEQMGSGAVD
ncbi:c-type cytochrome [Pseudohoeflea coraliihabitans]|uniref:C-type cytochrome n=1 Tax=Pseudohoeflea coraliihabitans TaxID=2860393 RepID=A0ABS6WQZ4_9HYPH|nr:c-type cytochrome [Pseudohoeflea sp. DP4N28-3]MBW3098386.1 c-type cytochrome [Pseudohoeflea sp. DP4N28-3]